MLEIRKSIFSEVGKMLEKNKITKSILFFANNSGIGDFFYRIFSKKYLEERIYKLLLMKNQKEYIKN